MYFSVASLLINIPVTLVLWPNISRNYCNANVVKNNYIYRIPYIWHSSVYCNSVMVKLKELVANMMTSKLKFIALLLFVATPTFATPMYYTFEGTVDSFSTLNFNSAPSASDFGITLGSTSIYHVFEIDFDKEGFYTANQSNVMAVSNSIYVELLTQEFLNDNYGNNTFNHGLNIDLVGSNNDKSEIAGGSLTLISSASINTPNWRIQDWGLG